MNKHFLQLQAYTTKNKAHEEIQNYVRQWHNTLVDDESLKNMLNSIEEEISRINAKHAKCKDISLSIDSYTENSIQYSVFENFYLTAHKVNREELTQVELKKQFKISLYEDEILITTLSNREEAFRAKINYTEGKRMLIEDKYGMKHDWIETKDSALNYHECCGVLILFGIDPPEYSELCKKLAIR